MATSSCALRQEKEHAQEKKDREKALRTWDCCCRVLLLGDEDPPWRPWIAAAGDKDLGLGALRRSRGPGPGSAWDLGAWRRSRGGRADDGLAENFKSSDGGRRRWGYRFILGAAM
nr:uncharacterized protein LOC109782104 isoform X2 [Aegilops tauschii subsp. strangulata]